MKEIKLQDINIFSFFPKFGKNSPAIEKYINDCFEQDMNVVYKKAYSIKYTVHGSRFPTIITRLTPTEAKLLNKIIFAFYLKNNKLALKQINELMKYERS